MAINAKVKRTAKTSVASNALVQTKALKKACAALIDSLDAIDFSSVTPWVYNPLKYAWGAYAEYLDRFVQQATATVFLGMNPGPWGMAQTGIPFGEVSVVRDWLKISGKIGKPELEHPKRPIVGLECKRSEVSGARLWGLFRERFRTPEEFFQTSFVANYCPLVFMDTSGKNLTPDKFPKVVREQLHACCDRHLAATLSILKPKYSVGVGNYAYEALRRVIETEGMSDTIAVHKILHPSPASPASNRGWAQLAESALTDAGVWTIA